MVGAQQSCCRGFSQIDLHLPTKTHIHTHPPNILQNGTGKTTFVRMLAGVLKSDEEEAAIKAGDEELAETLGCVCLCLCVSVCYFVGRGKAPRMADPLPFFIQPPSPSPSTPRRLPAASRS